MGSGCGQCYSVSQQGRPRQRRRVCNLLGVVLGLLALFAMLALPVLHTADILIGVARPPGTFGAAPHLHSPELPTTLATTTDVPHEKSHNSLVCPVCQILSQTRHALVSTGASIALVYHSVTYVLGCTLRHTAPDLTASAPRAPPLLT